MRCTGAAVPGMALVVPFYALFRQAGLINTPWALVLTYLIFTLPLSIWLLKSYFDHLPREIEEAASVDGASRLRQLLVIVAPLARPAVARTSPRAWASKSASVISARTRPLRVLGR